MRTLASNQSHRSLAPSVAGVLVLESTDRASHQLAGHAHPYINMLMAHAMGVGDKSESTLLCSFPTCPTAGHSKCHLFNCRPDAPDIHTVHAIL